jgi:hypothetical protein
MKLCAGDWVEVRSKQEILGTLDKRGQLDNLPFMPEMFKYCGLRFRVWKRAHKTCDTVNKTGGRRMADAVHLEELRCDGQAHGGCQAECLIFWKEAWLKRIGHAGKLPTESAGDTGPSQVSAAMAVVNRVEGEVVAGTKAAGSEDQSGPTYVCQATQLPAATSPLSWWDIRQYCEDYASGNTRLGQLFFSFVYAGYYRLVQAGIGLGPFLRRLYDLFQNLRGGVPFPRRSGSIPVGQPTPASALNLRPGELVRVKSFGEILSTLDTDNKNRGLYFDAEEVPFCGGTFQVKGRVGRIINEKTGKMMTFKTESVILEGVYCQGRYSDKRLGCPRSIYPMWREVWLERATESSPAKLSEKHALTGQFDP